MLLLVGVTLFQQTVTKTRHNFKLTGKGQLLLYQSLITDC